MAKQREVKEAQKSVCLGGEWFEQKLRTCNNFCSQSPSVSISSCFCHCACRQDCPFFLPGPLGQHTLKTHSGEKSQSTSVSIVNLFLLFEKSPNPNQHLCQSFLSFAAVCQQDCPRIALFFLFFCPVFLVFSCFLVFFLCQLSISFFLLPPCVSGIALGLPSYLLAGSSRATHCHLFASFLLVCLSGQV